MKKRSKASSTTIIYRQIVRNEQLYQQALAKGSEFSKLKGFRNIIKELRSTLEKRSQLIIRDQ